MIKKRLKFGGIAAAGIAMLGSLASLSPVWAQQYPQACQSGYYSLGIFYPYPGNDTCNYNNQLGNIVGVISNAGISAVNSHFRSVRDGIRSPTYNGVATGGGVRSFAPSGFDTAAISPIDDALNYAAKRNGRDPFAGAYNADMGRTRVASPVMTTGPAFGVWTEGYGDWEKRDAINASDVGRFQQTYGVTAGVDLTWQRLQSSDDAFLIGVLGSYMSSRVNFANTSTILELEGAGTGLYATYLKGGFSFDVTAKADFLGLLQDFRGVTPNNSFNLTNVALSSNAQYKVQLGNNSFVEPTGGLTYSRLMFDGAPSFLALKDADTLRLQAGARYGGSYDAYGYTWTPTITGLVFSNVVADGNFISTGGLTTAPTDQGRVRGEFLPELNVDFNNTWSSYIKGGVRFGEELVGGTAKVGVRKQW